MESNMFDTVTDLAVTKNRVDSKSDSLTHGEPLHGTTDQFIVRIDS